MCARAALCARCSPSSRPPPSVGLAPAAALAAPTDLFISEYVEGSSNNKAIEIFNGTGAAVDLAAGGYVLQVYFNGAATADQRSPLTGTVAAGDVFVFAHSGAAAAILAQADQTTGAGLFNGDDAIVLRKGGAAGSTRSARSASTRAPSGAPA